MAKIGKPCVLTEGCEFNETLRRPGLGWGRAIRGRGETQGMLWHVPGPPLWAEHSGSMEGLCGTACGPVETLGVRGGEWAGVHEQEAEGGRRRCSVDRDSGHHFNSLDSLDQRFSTWTLLAFGAVQLCDGGCPAQCRTSSRFPDLCSLDARRRALGGFCHF